MYGKIELTCLRWVNLVIKTGCAGRESFQCASSDVWKELETLYSFVSGCKERASPFASFEIDIDDDRDESRRVIGNIKRYLA